MPEQSDRVPCHVYGRDGGEEEEKHEEVEGEREKKEQGRPLKTMAPDKFNKPQNDLSHSVSLHTVA